MKSVVNVCDENLSTPMPLRGILRPIFSCSMHGVWLVVVYIASCHADLA